MQPAQDPHVYTPTPSDRKALEDADLVLYGGYDYEPGVIKIIDSTSSSVPKIAVFEAAVPKPLLGEEHHHGEEEHSQEEHSQEEHSQEEHAHNEADHSHGETADELVPDPHIWHNAQNGAAIVEVVRSQLAQLVPDQANLYQANAAQLTQQLAELDRWIKTQVATVPDTNRKLVTTHEALGYYAEAYGFELEGTIEGVSTEEKPSAARMSELVSQLKTSQVPTIFVETTTNPKQLETVAREANVKIADQPLFIEGPGASDSMAPTYQQMLVTNTCTIVNGLGGQCDRTTAPGQSG
jgi:manganese/iron transport system substrate-binding protein